MGTSAKSTLPKIEECVNEVCTKEYRVPVVRRSIYSPHSDVTIGDLSDNENSDNEDDEESLEVPSATRVIFFNCYCILLLQSAFKLIPVLLGFVSGG